jgi:hypothetical protein
MSLKNIEKSRGGCLCDGAREGRRRAQSWLISTIPVYLTGFLKYGIRPETAKISQKCARITHGTWAFTTSALIMIAPYLT